MSDSEVRLKFGEPTDTGGGSRKYKWRNIWRYGDNIEVIFSPKEHVVVMILINFYGDQAAAGESRYRLCSGGIQGGMSRQEFIEVLLGHGHNYTEQRIEANTTDIRVGTCIHAIFQAEKKESPQFTLTKLICTLT